jgi:hypothetical protein
VSQNSDSFVVNSNLVIMFSPIMRSFKWIAKILNMELNGWCLAYGNLFKSVNEGFVSKYIHFS